MMSDNAKYNGSIERIIVPILLALLVGGTVPWWWQYTPWYNGNPPIDRTTITIAYLGDPWNCNLPLMIRIGDREFAPQGSYFPVDGIKLGQQNYQINGTINCNILGSCQAHGTGSINILPNKSYNVIWAPNTCRVILQ